MPRRLLEVIEKVCNAIKYQTEDQYTHPAIFRAKIVPVPIIINIDYYRNSFNIDRPGFMTYTVCTGTDLTRIVFHILVLPVQFFYNDFG